MYKIIDKNGIELPRHWTGRYRTYEEAVKILNNINIDGEYKPYKMEEVK